MNLYSEIQGSGPTLLFVHGWTMTHRFFQRQKPLSDRFQLVFWDLPGHGESEKRKEGYTLADCADALRQIVTQQKFQNVIGLGWSMGGAILLEYLKKYGTEPFTQLLNVETVPWGEPDRFQAKAVRHAFLKNRERAAEKFIRKMFWKEPDAKTLSWMTEESEKTSTPTALKLYDEISVCDDRKTFRETALPILALMGRHGFHSDQVPEMKKLRPETQVVWFEESGHLPFWEEAEAFNETLRKILRESSLSSPRTR